MRWTWIVLVLLTGCKSGTNTPNCCVQLFAEKDWRTEGQATASPADTHTKLSVTWTNNEPAKAP